MHRMRMAACVALVLLLSTFIAHAATVDITSPADNSTVNAVAVLVQGTGSDPGIAKVVMRVNNGGWYVIAGTTNWSGWATVEPGANLVEVRAYDNAGLWGPIDELHLNGRALRPVVQFCCPVDGSTVDPGPVLIKGTALDDVSVVTVVMRVNGGVWQTATGTDNWEAWASIIAGANLIEARACDDAGLWGPIASMTLYGRDPVPPPVRPIVQFCSPINGATLIAGPVLIKGRALDDVTLNKVILRVNGGPWYVVSGTTVWMRWATIGLGANLIEARAYNNAGLWGPIASMTLNGVYDTPPTTVITTPADGATVDRAAVLVTGTAVDDGGVDKVILRVNGGSWYKIAGTTNWSGWATIIPGKNLIEARAYDNAGQWGPIVSVEVEGPANPAPVTLFNSPADGTTVYASRVLVTGTAIDDVSVDKVVMRVNSGPWYLATGTSNWSREVPINIGLNLIEARAVDNLGRWGPIAAMTLNGGQTPMVLRSAGAFAILAGSTVSNTGPTVVNGFWGSARAVR